MNLISYPCFLLSLSFSFLSVMMFISQIWEEGCGNFFRNSTCSTISSYVAIHNGDWKLFSGFIYFALSYFMGQFPFIFNLVPGLSIYSRCLLGLFCVCVLLIPFFPTNGNEVIERQSSKLSCDGVRCLGEDLSRRKTNSSRIHCALALVWMGGSIGVYRFDNFFYSDMNILFWTGFLLLIGFVVIQGIYYIAIYYGCKKANNKNNKQVNNKQVASVSSSEFDIDVEHLIPNKRTSKQKGSQIPAETVAHRKGCVDYSDKCEFWDGYRIVSIIAEAVLGFFLTFGPIFFVTFHMD